MIRSVMVINGNETVCEMRKDWGCPAMYDVISPFTSFIVGMTNKQVTGIKWQMFVIK